MVVHTLGICFYEGTVTSSSKKDTLLSTSGNMPPGMFNYSEAQTNLWTYMKKPRTKKRASRSLCLVKEMCKNTTIDQLYYSVINA
jgi:hypothetical protein